MCSEWTDDPRGASQPALGPDVGEPIGTGHPVPRVEIPHAGLSYACQDCDAVFRVDPADPFEAHGRYLDHLEVHEADEVEPDHNLPPDAVDVSLEHLLGVLLDGNKLVGVMDDDEAAECMRAILTDQDERQRAFASGALAVGAAVTLRFPGQRSHVFMSELMRALRDVTPWGDSEDHR